MLGDPSLDGRSSWHHHLISSLLFVDLFNHDHLLRLLYLNLNEYVSAQDYYDGLFVELVDVEEGLSLLRVAQGPMMRSAIKVLSRLKVELAEHRHLYAYQLIYEKGVEGAFVLQPCELVLD